MPGVNEIISCKTIDPSLMKLLSSLLTLDIWLDLGCNTDAIPWIQYRDQSITGPERWDSISYVISYLTSEKVSQHYSRSHMVLLELKGRRSSWIVSSFWLCERGMQARTHAFSSPASQTSINIHSKITAILVYSLLASCYMPAKEIDMARATELAS